MKTNIQYRRGFTLVELLVVIVIIAALAGLAAPMVMNQRKKADLIQATSNAKNIGLAMLEFDNSYGSYPDASTAATVATNTGTTAITGTDSNDYFRQLIVAEISQSEEMFFAKAAYSKKPDSVITGTSALEDGEVGFGYILNGTAALTSGGNPSRPIAVAPLAFPFATGQFDTDLYDFKAVALNIDNSVKQLQILKATKLAQLPGGLSLLTAGADFWGTGVTPTIANPTPK